MIYLNKEDTLKLISLEEIMTTIEDAYRTYENKKFYMPDRISEQYKNKTLLYMPCFLEKAFGTKCLTVFPDNKKLNLPVIDGIMVVNDYESGKVIGMIDGKILTSLRTGAVGGVSVKHLTPKNTTKLGLIGAGAQGFYQTLYACRARNIEKISIYDAYVKDFKWFIKELEKETGVKNIVVANNAEELLRNSEIIITATTSLQPVLPNKPELLEGKHFVGIGSYKPSMKEFPDALYSVIDKIYIDTEFAKEETGDLLTPINEGKIELSQIETLGNYLINEKEKEDIVNKTTVFKSVGMALFDLTVAKVIIDKALKEGVGQNIKL